MKAFEFPYLSSLGNALHEGFPLVGQFLFGWILALRELVPVERVVLLVVFLILFLPLKNKSENAEREKQRRTILTLSALAGILAIAMRMIRVVYP